MSMFMPEGAGSGQPQGGVSSITPSNPETTSEDIALMQRVLSAASRNPNLIPSDFMAYLIDYVQTSRLIIPIGQVFGFERIATQVVTVVSAIPSPVDGQLAMLRLGSSPYDYLPVIFDQTQGKWASPADMFGALGIVVNSTSFTPSSNWGVIPWRSFDTAGMKPQFRLGGYLVGSGAGTTIRAQVHLVAADSGSTSAFSEDIAATEVSVASSTSLTYVIGPWGDTALSVKDLLNVTASAKTDNTGFSNVTFNGGVQVRWISK